MKSVRISSCLAILLVTAALANPLIAAHAESAPTPTPVAKQMSIDAVAPMPTVASTPTPPRPVSIRLEGALKAIDPAVEGEWWTVDEHRVLVTVDTVISPPERIARVGDTVIVHAVYEGELITAVRIIVQKADSTDWFPIEFRGVIYDVPDNPMGADWRIGGITVRVDSKATEVTGADPRVGFYAQVVGYIGSDRKVLARSILILDPATVAAGFEFEGIVQSIPADGAGEWVIGNVRGRVDQNTKIQGAQAIGRKAEVVGKRMPDGSLYFQEIRIAEPEQGEIRVSGRIVHIDRDAYLDIWTIETDAGEMLELDVDGRTFVDESRARAAEGMWVEAIARRCLGGALCALRIRVERPA
jgi:hypothetical protein